MPSTILLSLVGAFYVFAGVVALRMGLTSRIIDRAIEAISLEKTSAAEDMRGRINLAIATLTFASGVLLLAQLDVAALAFAACAALQGAYLFLIAPRLLDPADPPSATGRRQSVNAFVIYLAATALVAWAWGMGRLTPLSEAAWPVLAAAGAALAAFAAYGVHGSRVPKHRRGHIEP